MTSVVERSRRARRLKKSIDLIRAQGNEVKAIAECLEIPLKRFYSYAEGKASPRLDEDYTYIMTSLKLLIDKPLPSKEPKQQEMFPVVVDQPADPEVDSLSEQVAKLKARNEYLEGVVSKLKGVLT